MKYINGIWNNSIIKCHENSNKPLFTVHFKENKPRFIKIKNGNNKGITTTKQRKL